MSIYFLGLINNTRSYYRQHFYVFFGVVKQNEKATFLKHSSLSFKLHKNERPEKEKGCYAYLYLLQLSIESFSGLASISRPCQMGGLFVVSESRSFHRVHSLPTGYSSSHQWCLVFVSSSQCCQVILFDIPISLKIICPEIYSLSSPLYLSPCVSLTLIITSSTLVLC